MQLKTFIVRASQVSSRIPITPMTIESSLLFILVYPHSESNRKPGSATIAISAGFGVPRMVDARARQIGRYTPGNLGQDSQ